MIGIAWRTLRRDAGTLFGAFLMVTVGAALITAFAIVQESVDNTRAPIERYTGIDVVASGDSGTFPGSLIDEIESVEGVDTAVPELNLNATLLDSGGSPVLDQEDTAQFAHSWTSATLTPFTVVEGREPAAAAQIAIDAALAERAGVSTGETVRVEIGGLDHEFELSGIVDPTEGPMEHQHALFLQPDQAEELADRSENRYDAIGVGLVPGTDDAQVGEEVERLVAQALAADVESPSGVPSHQVAWGADRGDLEGTMPDHQASASAMTMLVWIVAFMAVAVVGSALITSVRRRADQFALLRAVGATPRQVRFLCQAEALLISLLAVVAGGVVGALLAWGLIEVFRALGVVSPVLTVSYGPMPLLVSAAAVLAAAQVAAWFTARSALRIRPGEALAGREAAPVGRRRAIISNTLGVIAVLSAGGLQASGMAGAVPEALEASYGMIASLLVIVGVGFLGAAAIRLVALAARRPVALSPVGGYIAAANVRLHYRRYAGVSAPLAVGLAIAGWAMSGLPLFALDNADEVAERFDTEHIVRTPIVREEHTGLSQPAHEAVNRVEGVESTVGLRETWLAVDGEGNGPGQATGFEPGSATRGTVFSGQGMDMLDLGTIEGDPARVDAGQGLALGVTYAQRQGIELGETVQVGITGSESAAELEVAALFADDRNGQEAAVVATQALEGTTGRAWHEYVLVGGPVDRAELASVLSPGTVLVEDQATLRATYVEERRDAIDNLGTIATALVGVFLVVAAVNALALSASDRRDELMAMRRLNVGRRQIHAMVGWEMALTVVPAWLLGMAATLWMAVAMAGGEISAALWAFPWALLTGIGILAMLIALIGARGATNAALRERARSD